ncbi:efflux RND transporter permease subunit [Polynucleobacter sp. MWH-Loch1C5]|jgi:cobalt-zinc-cadmium resistance protein CzcA|uniref:efflux RND transporter permease subunit n=1 Tax=Polynucleobacter sp. MWH-Loch1C5 TaxID=2689108 RepID=UPI001C0E1DBD|nr:CusA/CzcA family heavy metal efflux RND transporter [Polynucleobacter sp. MWH-Loch1C5]MBU3542909.1 efflux RND transporter permease subunit [Polynucleobacter sp. MWH-Loch1C5]
MIDRIVRFALQQRLLVIVISIALFFVGLLAVKKLSVDAFPDVTNVQVQVATEAPGRSPEEVERFITVPIEIAMTGMPGLVEMRSLNRNGISVVTLVFTDKTDIYFARQLVMERLMEVVPRMPEGVAPVMAPPSTGLGEIYQYTIEHPSDGNRELTVDELKERRIIQDWVVRPMLRSIPGVAEINTMGGYAQEYHVLVNPDRLRHYQLRLEDVYTALARNNANSGGGQLPVFAERYLIRGLGLITKTEDIGQIVLKEVRGTPVFVKNVAEVTIGSEVRQGAIIKNGATESVAGIVQMVRGANAREVVNRIKTKVEEINELRLLPEGLQIVPFYDRTDLVNAAMFNVAKVLIEGIILVIIVLFIFLGDVRSSLIVVATLVLTPLLTFLMMNRYGISANLMSLGGLAIAIGIMVDGSVVVVENTFAKLGERLKQGESKNRIVLEAAAEVGKPVLFGVGIIILVFMPLLSLEGMEGKMFAPLALTIAIALTISLLLSFTLSPVLCSYILKGGAEHDTKFVAKLKAPYMRWLDWCLANPKQVVQRSILALGASLVGFVLLGKAFIPVMQEGAVTPVIVRAPNISLEESIKLEFEAMKRIMTIPGVEKAVSRLGRGESPADPGQPFESDPIVSLKPLGDRDLTQEEIANQIREKLKTLPGIELAISQPIAARVDEMVSGVRSQVAVKIFGDDLETLKNLGTQMGVILSSTPGSTDLRIEQVSGQNYINIKINRDAIARHGINVADVNDVIETAIGGKQATTVFEGERRFPLVLRYPIDYRNDIKAIENIALRSPNGALVLMKDLAEIAIIDGPAQISRESGKRRLVIGVNVTGRDLGGFVKEAQTRIAKEMTIPSGYYLEWGGQFENMERAMARLMIIIPLTIAAIFFLLFMLFKSVRLAGLIILVLPFASIGGVFGLLISGEYLSVPAAVGFINLWGIAVLNGVVLVSFIKQLREDGLSLREALIDGCTHRFRPVMMTASVAMLALIPMLFSSGPGSEVTRPLAVVVISGLITSTSLTLLVLPVLYGWFEDKETEA